MAAIDDLGSVSSRSHAAPSASTLGRTSSGPQSGHRLDVGARGEDLRSAPDTRAPTSSRSTPRAIATCKLEPHLQVDRVRRWPIQPDHADAVVDLEPGDSRPWRGCYTRGRPLAARRLGPGSDGSRRRGRFAVSPNASRGIGRIGARTVRSTGRQSPTRPRDPEQVLQGRGRRGPSAGEMVDAAPPVSSSTSPSAETTSGPSNAQVPARSRSRSSATASDARPDRSTATGASARSPGPKTNGGDAARPGDHRREPERCPPRSRACCGSRRARRPLVVTASSASPSLAGTGRRPRRSRPGTDIRTNRRTPAAWAARTPAGPTRGSPPSSASSSGWFGPPTRCIDGEHPAQDLRQRIRVVDPTDGDLGAQRAQRLGRLGPTHGRPHLVLAHEQRARARGPPVPTRPSP